MGKLCELCGKGAMSGNLVSHSERKTKRIWAPNVQVYNTVINGTPRRINLCTRCLRSIRNGKYKLD
ncbi:MAG: 50S ribosomal protein L28 [Clostridia bacterium]|nr:50S ribosomal protein L28 [Clostridia bacterium]